MPGVQYGAAVFPRAVLAVMFGAGAWLTVKGLMTLRGTGWLQVDAWARRPGSWIMFALIVAGMVFYILAADAIGFVPVAGVIIFVLLLAARGRAHLLSSAILALSFPLLLYYIFVNALRVPLPAGWLGGVL
ncbi:MAG: tripartite tricarboxylate transporter TctB family protein [Proteobacteria bacterium]|nr:MAG: tripartite tricarboxylate transporter TctB family protein [Pseudomonadota bacterium]